MTDLLELVNRSRRAFQIIRLPEATIVAANGAAVELYREPAEVIIGRHASSLFHGADEVHTAVALSALAAGAVDSYCRSATAAGVNAWLCVRRFDLEEARVAAAMTVPVEQHRPLDGVEEEFATATDLGSVSTTPAPYITRADPSASRHPPDSTFAVLDRLPARQREIVAALLGGERTTAIAASLFVSASTVRSHISLIFKAFGVHSQTELLALLRSHKAAVGDAGAHGRHRPAMRSEAGYDPS